MTIAHPQLGLSGTVGRLMDHDVDQVANGAGSETAPRRPAPLTGGQSPAWMRPARRRLEHAEPRTLGLDAPAVVDAPVLPADATSDGLDATLAVMSDRIAELSEVLRDLVRAQAATDERLDSLADAIRAMRRRTPLQAKRESPQ